jgi:hypothetical protein
MPTPLIFVPGLEVFTGSGSRPPAGLAIFFHICHFYYNFVVSHVLYFSKSHTPAARRTGKSAKTRGEAGSDALVSVALSKQSLCELRSMQQLPQKLHTVVEALCVLTQLQV